MSSNICCVVLLTRREYDLMTIRLSAYGVTFSHFKQLQLGFLRNIDANQKSDNIKPSTQKINVSHKFENQIIRITQRNNSIFLFGNSKENVFNERFMMEASWYRVQNNFMRMMKEWSIFSNMKQISNKKINIEVYSWKKLFEFEFLHAQDSNQEILLIIHDLTATNYIDKNVKLDGQFFKTKMNSHFRDVFAMFCSNFYESQPFVPLPPVQVTQQNQHHDHHQGQTQGHGQTHNQGQQANNRHMNRPTTKSINEFEQRLKSYVQKLVKLVQYKTENPKWVSYWIIRLIYIIQFVLKQQSKENK